MKIKNCFEFTLKLKDKTIERSLYLKHGQSEGPVQVTIGLYHCFMVEAF